MKGMETDDLLCSRNARPQKALVGRAQWTIRQPPSLRENERSRKDQLEWGSGCLGKFTLKRDRCWAGEKIVCSGGLIPGHPGETSTSKLGEAILVARCGLVWDKARPWVKGLSWQTQGGRV